MTERTKLHVDMLKAFTVGFYGAVVFRDHPMIANVIFAVLGPAAFAGAWVLTERADEANEP